MAKKPKKTCTIPSSPELNVVPASQIPDSFGGEWYDPDTEENYDAGVYWTHAALASSCTDGAAAAHEFVHTMKLDPNEYTFSVGYGELCASRKGTYPTPLFAGQIRSYIWHGYDGWEQMHEDDVVEPL